jgi:hypothetical protein
MEVDKRGKAQQCKYAEEEVMRRRDAKREI